MKCCSECFGDRGLRKEIIPFWATEVATCSYCGSQNVEVVPPAELAPHFELLVSAYRLDQNGKLLVHWFRNDWGMFEHPRMDDSRVKDLLAEILNDGEIVRQTFSPSDPPETNRLGDWETLCDELMYRNRFFPQLDLDLERLSLLLDHLKLGAGEVPDLWYRARIQNGDAAYTVNEMGAPPRRIASHGRANPAGIPYLYLASSQSAAISEIRPYPGEISCVADFRTPQDLRLVDLRRPPKMVSPFLLSGAEDICRMRRDLPFLERLGQALTKPVVPQAAAIDYTPSQYFCEFIKKCGYDGVVYRSSVSTGINLALFYPARAQVGAITFYKIASVSVEAQSIEL